MFVYLIVDLVQYVSFQVTVTYRSRVERPDNIKCKGVTASIVENIARGEFKTAARMMFTCEGLVKEIKEQSLNLLEEECTKLTAIQSDFILRKTSAQDLENFSFDKFQSDLKRLSPFFLSILSKVTKNSRNHICASAAVAIRGRNNQLSAFSHYINTVLQHGGAKTAVFARLCKFGISTTQDNARVKQRELASTCGKDLQAMKRKLEAYAEQKLDTHTVGGDRDTHAVGGEVDTRAVCGEMYNLSITAEDFSDLAVGFLAPPIEPECTLQSTPPSTPPPPPPPTYSIIFDNLDFYKQTHHQSETNSNNSIHWTHHIAVQDRVSTHHLPNNEPVKPLPLFQIGDCLPTPEIEAHLRTEFIILGSRILTKHLPALKQFAPAVIYHIPHQYSETMTQPSTEVSYI